VAADLVLAKGHRHRDKGLTKGHTHRHILHMFKTDTHAMCVTALNMLVSVTLGLDHPHLSLLLLPLLLCYTTSPS
jgi:hypothetical protein